MGQLVSLSNDESFNYKILLFGLDASGKTTILYRLKLNETMKHTIPTIGFNLETLKFKGILFTAWDVGLRDKGRPLLRHYIPETDALVFVVDSTDSDRFEQAKDYLHMTLDDSYHTYNLPILLLCNKQDRKLAASPDDITKGMGLQYSNLNYYSVGCSAVTGEGLLDGMEWLADTLRSKTPMKNIKLPSQEEYLVKRFATMNPNKILLDFDPSLSGGNVTLRRFSTIQLATECPFAKAANLWGGKGSDDVEKDSLEEQAKRNVDVLTIFVQRLLQGERLDGFCVELIDEDALSADVEVFGECVRKFLTALSDLDPAKEFMMRKKYIDKRGWRFRFMKEDFFVTTFAPCYPPTSSRYAFDCGHAFILFQPELSFLRHNLPHDLEAEPEVTTETVTNADYNKGSKSSSLQNRNNVRVKTRAAYKRAGRGYHSSPKDPMSYHVVKPLNDDGTSFVQWWVKK